MVIQGKKDALQDIESIKVSGTALNVSGKSETVEAAIDLTDYLPKGVSLIDEQENDSIVTIEIEGVSQATYDVPAENITFNNVASGYSISAGGIRTGYVDRLPIGIAGTVSIRYQRNGRSDRSGRRNPCSRDKTFGELRNT